MSRVPVLVVVLVACAARTPKETASPVDTAPASPGETGTDGTDTDDPEVDWSLAEPVEVRTVLVDPEGDNLHSLIVAPDGALYVTTTNPPNHVSDDVAVVDVDAGTITRIATGLPFPEGIDLGPDGALYTACWNDLSVHRTTLDGDDSVFSSAGDFPTMLIFAANGDLIVNNWNASTLDRITPDGDRALFSTHDAYLGPHGMAWGDDGALYVGNYYDGKVFRVDDAGAATELAQLPYDSTLGHLVWLDGHLYATAFELNQVFRIDPETGDTEAIAGSGSDGDVDGLPDEAELSGPNGLAADPVNHRLFVAMGGVLKVIPFEI